MLKCQLRRFYYRLCNYKEVHMANEGKSNWREYQRADGKWVRQYVQEKILDESPPHGETPRPRHHIPRRDDWYVPVSKTPYYHHGASELWWYVFLVALGVLLGVLLNVHLPR
jgi:hypothetical protein